MKLDRPSTKRKLLLFVVLVTSHPVSNVLAITNMYQNTGGTHGGTTWGKFCYSRGDYQPSCGWEAIVSVSYTITRVEIWDSTAAKIDDYTYKLIPTSQHRDVTSKLSHCQNVNIYGSFSNTQPDVAVTYSCVCTSPSNPTCESVPYTLVLPWNYVPPETTTHSSTTSADVITEDTSDSSEETTTEGSLGAGLVGTIESSVDPTAAVSSGWIMSPSNSSASSMKLMALPNVCYTGVYVQQVPVPVFDLSDCASFCLTDDECEGINFRSEHGKCDRVHQAVSEGGADQDPVSGCQLWKVVWKN